MSLTLKEPETAAGSAVQAILVGLLVNFGDVLFGQRLLSDKAVLTSADIILVLSVEPSACVTGVRHSALLQGPSQGRYI